MAWSLEDKQMKSRIQIITMCAVNLETKMGLINLVNHMTEKKHLLT